MIANLEESVTKENVLYWKNNYYYKYASKTYDCSKQNPMDFLKLLNVEVSTALLKRSTSWVLVLTCDKVITFFFNEITYEMMPNVN